eukprot:3920954-Heterocapsa_arctica.AAC.1
MFKDLSDAVSHKFQKVGMTRWFQYIGAAEEFCDKWTERYIVLLYLSLCLGLFKKAQAKDFISVKAGKTGEHDDVEKTTTAQDREQVQQMRRSCKNTVEFVAMVMADRSLWQMNVIIVEMAKPIQEWHTEQNKMNRSPEESIQWWAEQSATFGLAQVRDVFARLHAGEIWRKIGGHDSSNSAACLGWGTDHPRVETENEMATTMGEFALALAKRRMCSLSHFASFPGMFPALLNPGAAHR